MKQREKENGSSLDFMLLMDLKTIEQKCICFSQKHKITIPSIYFLCQSLKLQTS